MEYQKIINLLDNSPNELSKFKTKNWFKINDESQGTYDEDNQIRFETSMLRSSLCDYNNAYILLKGTVTVLNTTSAGAAANNANEKVIFKTCASFIKFMSRINQYASR